MSGPSHDAAGEDSSRDHAGYVPGLTPAVTGMNAIGAVVVLLMALLVNVDVLGRWMGIVAIVYLQLAHAIAVGRLTRSEMLLDLTERRMPRLNLTLRTVFNLMGAFVLAVIVYGQLPRLVSAWENGFYKGNPGVFQAPTWPLEAILLVGAIFGIVQFGVLAWQNVALMRALNATPGRT